MTEHERILAMLTRQDTTRAILHLALCLLIGFIGFLILRNQRGLDKKLDAIETQMSAEEQK